MVTEDEFNQLLRERNHLRDQLDEIQHIVAKVANETSGPEMFDQLNDLMAEIRSLRAIENAVAEERAALHGQKPKDTRHPTQPVVVDEKGTKRFKQNKIVDELLSYASARGMDMNAVVGGLMFGRFSEEDYVQFVQLIGYSLGGFAELTRVSPEAFERATFGETP